MIKPRSNPGYIKPHTIKALATLTAELKKRMLDFLDVSGSCRAIDIGCGPGLDIFAMAESLDEKGFAVGVDYDDQLISEAQEFKSGSPVGPTAHFCNADATALPFRSAIFDACRCERLLQHITQPDLVIGEMVRVLKPGGRIAIADTDWGTLSIDTPEVDIERRLAHLRAKLYLNGFAGRQLFRLLKQHGTADIQVSVFPIIWTDYALFRQTSFALNRFEEMAVASGTVTKAALKRFTDSLASANAKGIFFASGSIMLATGYRP